MKQSDELLFVLFCLFSMQITFTYASTWMSVHTYCISAVSDSSESRYVVEVCGQGCPLLRTHQFALLSVESIWNYIIQWCGNPWNCIGSFLFFFPHNSQGIVLWYRAKVEMRQRLLFTLDPKVPGLSGEWDGDKHQVHLYILLTAAFPTTHSALAIKHDYRCCITSSSVTLNSLNPKLKLTQE